MPQFEYQIVEQAGGRVSHLNERLMQLVTEGWEPFQMSGASPHVSIMLRKPATEGAAAGRAAPARTAAPAVPRPAQPGQQAPPQSRPPAP